MTARRPIGRVDVALADTSLFIALEQRPLLAEMPVVSLVADYDVVPGFQVIKI